MFAVSQIIERNLHRIEPGGTVLWINPETDDCWRALNPRCKSLKLFSQDRGCYASLQKAGANIDFSAFPDTRVKYDRVIVNLPRQKALLAMLLDCAADLVTEDGVLWLAGENKAGIKSADKLLKLHFAQIRKVDNARHCSLYEATTRSNQDRFNPLNYRHHWVMDCADREIQVLSYPGVFAHGRLDDGTALLLDTLAKLELKGEVLDFACGAGLIGACIATHHAHARVTLLDTSALAVRSSKETLEANGVIAGVLASDGLTEVTGSFDLIVSNPPIHAGVKTDNRLGMRLLDLVHKHIRPGGQLIMVANVHLPYESWLSKRFKRFSELAVNENYKVIVAKT